MSERADMTIYAFKRVHEPHPDDESRPWCKEDLGMTGEPPWVVVPRYDLDPGADFDLLCDDCAWLRDSASEGEVP